MGELGPGGERRGSPKLLSAMHEEVGRPSRASWNSKSVLTNRSGDGVRPSPLLTPIFTVIKVSTFHSCNKAVRKNNL